MDFEKLLKQRRSIRKYQDRFVPAKLIKKIIGDSVKAPNAGNKQPWKFLIISDTELIKRMSDASKATILADIQKDPDSPLKGYEKSLQNDNLNVFYNAPCLICIIGKPEVSTIAVDCALAGSYLMLSATSHGLGTCWVDLGKEIRTPELLERIGMPEGYKIFAPIIVGYPETIPKMRERKEPEIIEYVKLPL